MNDLKKITEQIFEKHSFVNIEKAYITILMMGVTINRTDRKVYDIAKLSRRLNEIGLTNSLAIYSDPDDVEFKLSPTAITNYIEKNRTETIKELLS